MVPNPKPAKGSATAARRKRKAAEQRHERQEKLKVRLRDLGCRFPLCPCKALGLALHVAHSRHKGLGGNPNGSRSSAESMVLVCRARHRDDRISLDRGTLRWEARTQAGADGPIAWYADLEALEGRHATGDIWHLLAVEERPGFVYVLTSSQGVHLRALAARLKA